MKYEEEESKNENAVIDEGGWGEGDLDIDLDSNEWGQD